uniref:Epoxide hydrolase n=1 Tax=Rhabditophanes sp. KR3021 TaxID=114890 RepID=A0AC35U1H9_9BILA
MSLKHIVLAVLVAFVAYKFFTSSGKEEIDIPKDGYFGSGEKKADNEAIIPFKIHVPDAELADIKQRLTNSRVGHSTLEDVKSFEYGINTQTLASVKDYWLTKFNWRKQEVLLNSFPQFKTEIEGLNIHYLHIKPSKNKYKTIFPLILVHGWPGSIFEFHKMIPMLSDPAIIDPKMDFAFELIIPSIPGYGYSDSSKKTGLNQFAVARIFKKLMTRLGHKKWFAQGGDWGSLITGQMARLFPEHLLGLHVNMAFIQASSLKQLAYIIIGNIRPSLIFKNPIHQNYSTLRVLGHLLKESGYMHIQGTKPDTVGVALNDSPLGLAAYILEKFSTWTNPDFVQLEDGGLTKKFTMDELLTNIMIYYTNGNIVSSQRFYKESFRSSENQELAKQYVSVKTGYAAFPFDLGERVPEELFQLSYNMVTYNSFEGKEGGHFAAFEVPELLARDVINFVKTVNKLEHK